MKVRWFCIVGVIALASLAAGCKSPSGSSSFTKFENPFKSFSKKPLADSSKASTEVAEKNSQNPRPSLGERPNISSPVGGYSSAAATTADPAQREAVQRDAQAIQGSYAAASEPYPYHAVANQSSPVQQSPYEAAYQQQYAQPYAATNPSATPVANPAAGYGVPAGYTPTAYGVPQTQQAPQTAYTYQEPAASSGYGAPSAPQVYDNPYGAQPAYAAAPTTPTAETPYGGPGVQAAYPGTTYGSGNTQVSPYGYR